MTIATMINELTFQFDRFDYDTKDFLPHDEMTFVRRVLMEKMLDGLYFLRYGGKKSLVSIQRSTPTTRRAATKQIARCTGGRSACNGFAYMNIASCTDKHEQLDEMYSDLQHAWFAAHGNGTHRMVHPLATHTERRTYHSKR